MYAFVDTETTGLPRGGVQPRIVSIAWILADSFARPPSVRGAIVRPEGFTIPVEATAIHGISTAQALREGRALGQVMEEFAADLARHGARGIVAHNLAYDRPVIEAEYARLARPSPIAGLEQLCTMRAARRAFPGERAGLSAVHQRLFGAAVEDAHSAAADVLACCRVFFALDPAVRAADPRPDPALVAEDAACIACTLDWAAGHPEFDRRDFVESLRAWVEEGRTLTERQRAALLRTMARWGIAAG